ncbi:MAG: SPFH domain-containing protein [Candidatus Dormibacteria bacterium]
MDLSTIPVWVWPIVIVIVGFVLFSVLVKSLWRVAEPNEALIISGWHHQPVQGVSESMGFRIVTGRGTFVLPIISRVRKLSLDASETELFITCVTTQGIRVNVKAVVIYKVGDDFASISNAARRFLDKAPQELEGKIKHVFEGHLRSIVGSVTIEQMVRDRETLTERARQHSGEDMQKLGLVIDSLQIKEIEDTTGYIANLSAPPDAEMKKLARIAQSQADREATQREQESVALKAAAVREAEIKKAQYQAEIDRAQKEAEQAGPLAQQKAMQMVVQEQTKVAEYEAQRTEQALQAQIRRPADAEAYRQRTVAQGERDARIAGAEAHAQEIKLAAVADAERTKVTAEAQAQSTRMIGEADGGAAKARGLGQAEAVKAGGLAEAQAIKARADALAQNQEAVINQQLAEHAADIVAAAAKPIGDIDNLVVLNGTEGVQQAVMQSLAQGFAAVQQLRGALAPQSSSNGQGPAASPQHGPSSDSLSVSKESRRDGNPPTGKG